MFQKPIPSATLQNSFTYPACVHTGCTRWQPDDNNDKRFIRIFKTVNGQLVETAIQNIEIGKPAILQLATGDIVRTSSVLEWTCYGHIGIRTRNREYYYI